MCSLEREKTEFIVDLSSRLRHRERAWEGVRGRKGGGGWTGVERNLKLFPLRNLPKRHPSC